MSLCKCWSLVLWQEFCAQVAQTWCAVLCVCVRAKCICWILLFLTFQATLKAKSFHDYNLLKSSNIGFTLDNPRFRLILLHTIIIMVPGKKCKFYVRLCDCICVSLCVRHSQRGETKQRRRKSANKQPAVDTVSPLPPLLFVMVEAKLCSDCIAKILKNSSSLCTSAWTFLPKLIIELTIAM